MKGELSSILGIGGILIAALILFGMYIVYHRRKNRRQLMSRSGRTGAPGPPGNTVMRNWRLSRDTGKTESRTGFRLTPSPGMIWIWTGFLCWPIIPALISGRDICMIFSIHLPFPGRPGPAGNTDRIFCGTRVRAGAGAVSVLEDGKPGRQPVFDAVYNLAM